MLKAFSIPVLVSVLLIWKAKNLHFKEDLLLPKISALKGLEKFAWKKAHNYFKKKKKKDNRVNQRCGSNQ